MLIYLFICIVFEARPHRVPLAGLELSTDKRNWVDVCFGLCLINIDTILPSLWAVSSFADEVR